VKYHIGNQPPFAFSSTCRGIVETHLVSTDAQLGLARLPRSVTAGDRSGSPGGTSLDPVENGQAGVGVSAAMDVVM
jgi:hypothetical protein